MTSGEWLIIGISGFFLAWYIGLNIFNRRRGVATYQWLRRGLLQVGEITEAQWLGSSSTGGRLVIAHAQKPFRRLEAMYLLETRELLPYWIISHIQGRRDEIIIKASLRTTPHKIIQVSREKPHPNAELASRDLTHPGEQLQVSGEFTISTSAPIEEELMANLVEFLSKSGNTIRNISFQRESPHLEIRLNIKPALLLDPEIFFSGVKTWL
ncbi:MAG: hypothetical protein JSV42_04650 [Chloroflexota bacterium]|nr:MAG: hypothetical protein JSV42_04650 [Chloroflexota bacterium]